jgi:hypothetical protein
VDTVKIAGGNVLSVCVMVNRNPEMVGEAEVGAPFRSLGELPTEVFDEENCPLCKSGIPVNTKIGHGKKFVDSHKS